MMDEDFKMEEVNNILNIIQWRLNQSYNKKTIKSLIEEEINETQKS